MSIRILIVDDEEPVVKALDVILRDLGFETVTTTDARAVEVLLDQQPFDILVCDNRMPGKTGVEVFAQARRTHPTTMRIMMTAMVDRETSLRAINEGHVDYLIEKPWRVPQLRTLLDEAAGVVRSRKRAPEPNVAAAARSFRRSISSREG